MQREVLTGRQHHGMAGVVAALVPHDPVHAATEQVGGLTLALVAPLGADEHDCRHGISPGYCGRADGEQRLPSLEAISPLGPTRRLLTRRS